MDPLQLFGWFGSIILAINAVPQFIKTWKTKKTRDLSLGFLWLWVIGVLMVWIYIMLGDAAAGEYHFPLYLNYGLNELIGLYLLYAKYRYGKPLKKSGQSAKKSRK